jgi:hypothetical protein
MPATLQLLGNTHGRFQFHNMPLPIAKAQRVNIKSHILSNSQRRGGINPAAQEEQRLLSYFHHFVS